MKQFGGDFLTDAAGTGFSHLLSREAQEDAQDHAKYMMKRRYQWTVQDMRKAGLNPILATGMNPTVPSPGPAVSAPPTQFGATSARRAQRDQLAASSRALGTQAELNLQKARESASAQSLNDARTEIERTRTAMELVLLEALQDPDFRAQYLLRQVEPSGMGGAGYRALGTAFGATSPPIIEKMPTDPDAQKEWIKRKLDRINEEKRRRSNARR